MAKYRQPEGRRELGGQRRGPEPEVDSISHATSLPFLYRLLACHIAAEQIIQPSSSDYHQQPELL